jgi:hypothetical protein
MSKYKIGDKFKLEVEVEIFSVNQPPYKEYDLKVGEVFLMSITEKRLDQYATKLEEKYPVGTVVVLTRRSDDRAHIYRRISEKDWFFTGAGFPLDREDIPHDVAVRDIETYTDGPSFISKPS